MIVDLLVAFAVAVLAGMGVGGGGLLVLYLTLLGHVGQLEAQGINLVFFLAASGGSLFLHGRRRRLRWRRVLILSVSGVLSALFGGYLATLVSRAILRKLFGGLLVLSGGVSLFSKERSQEPPS